MEERIFRYAVLGSLILHAIFFARLFIEGRQKEQVRQVEMTYRIKTPKPKPQEVKMRSAPPKVPQAISVPLPPPQVSVSGSPLLKDMAGLADNFKMYERKPEKVKGQKVMKEVSIPMLKSEKINTPSYVSYYQIVRDRIRERAYTNYTKLSMGEIFLSFIIRNDGALSELQILESKSAANDFLREVGLSSVREAAPFPPFPSDLNYPELTFNIQISFQYREE